MEKREPFQQMVLEQMDIYMKKKSKNVKSILSPQATQKQA